MPILFELEFDLERATKANYEEFIKKLREKLAARYWNNRPVLAYQQMVPTQFFDVVLHTHSHAVRFRFRADNLYMIGYQMGTQWLEFSRDESNDGSKNKNQNQKSTSKSKKNKSKSNSNDAVHWITERGTEFLGFNGGYYGHLAGIAGRSMEQIRIGYQSIVHAINQLAVSTDMATRAHSLIVVIMAICESARLIPVFEHIADSFPTNSLGTSGGDGGFIETWIIKLIQNWHKMSEAVLRHDACRAQTFILQDSNIRIPPDNRVIRTLEDMLTVIGILLGLCITTTVSKRRHRRSITSDMCFRGSFLVQVFSVCIDNIDNEDPGDLYGTITIDNGLYTEYIYNRSYHDPEFIKPGEFATLTGPSKAMSALGNFTIKLLLRAKDSFLSFDRLSPDALITYDVISWEDANYQKKEIMEDAAGYYDNLYDELISCQLHSNRGTVTVNYAVLTDAVAAQVSITLEEGGKSSCQVYGHAALSYDSWDHDSTNNCFLFETSSTNYVEVHSSKLIPLLRSVFAVPLDTSLDLAVRLYDHDKLYTPYDLIAKGIVKLSPPDEIPGTTKNKIKGDEENYVTVTTRWTFAV